MDFNIQCEVDLISQGEEESQDSQQSEADTNPHESQLPLFPDPPIENNANLEYTAALTKIEMEPATGVIDVRRSSFCADIALRRKSIEAQIL